MSLPNIPNIEPNITLTKEEVCNLMIASIALKGLGLSHILNAEAEKIQYVLGTLHDFCEPGCLEDILRINDSVRKTLNSVVQNELLNQIQMSIVIENYCTFNGCIDDRDQDCLE